MLCCSTIHGRIDQVNQILDLDKEEQGGARLVVFPFCNIIYMIISIDIQHWKLGVVKSTLCTQLLLDELFKLWCALVNYLNTIKIISAIYVGDVAQW